MIPGGPVERSQRADGRVPILPDPMTDAPDPMRMLVVDDEPTITFAIRRYFGGRGMRVDAAADADSALALLARDAYQVAIVDLRLSGQGDTQGFEVLEQARRSHPETKLVLLTAYGSPSLEREARRRGADAVLRKPIPLSELAEHVARLVGPASSGSF